MIKIGTRDVKSLYLGTTPAKAVYKGSELIWEASQPPTPVPTGATALTFVLPTAPYVLSLNYTQSAANAVTIDWGDGSTPTTSPTSGATSQEHILTTAGTHTIYMTATDQTTWTPGGGTQSAPITTDTDILTSVVFGGSVQAIGDFAFCDQGALASVTLPENATAVGEGAFMRCFGLTGIVIPDSVTSIGDDAFGGCASLTSVNVGTGVTSIGMYAFSDCVSLETVWLPFGLTVLDEGTFGNCAGLESVTLPYTLTQVEDSAFSWCDDLADVYFCGTSAMWQNVTVGSDNAPLLAATMHYATVSTFFLATGTRGNKTYDDAINVRVKQSRKQGVVINWGDGNVEVSNDTDAHFFHDYNGSGLPVMSFVEAPGVTWQNWGGSLIKGRLDQANQVSPLHPLLLVSLSNIHTRVNNRCFAYAHSLGGFSGLRVTDIDISAFHGCESLPDAQFANGLTIGSDAFGDCSSLQEITPSIDSQNIQEIGLMAFGGCSALPQNVELKAPTVQDYAFYRTNTKKLWIRSSVVTLGRVILWECPQDAIIYAEPSSRPAGWDADFDGIELAANPPVRATVVWGQTTRPW